jgi:hypothetical protein
MKKLRTFILITGILVAGQAFSAQAQKRPAKTSSAKAYYGTKSDKPNHKVKKPKKPKSGIKKPTTNNKGKIHPRSGWVYRKERLRFEV